jgi:hypothetical protein
MGMRVHRDDDSPVMDRVKHMKDQAREKATREFHENELHLIVDHPVIVESRKEIQ